VPYYIADKYIHVLAYCIRSWNNNNDIYRGKLNNLKFSFSPKTRGEIFV